MNNFASQFNAFRTQQERDEAYLFELRRTNAVKREAIATLEEKIARCKEQEAEQKRKREIAENQQKEQMEKLSVNVIKAKNLLTDVEGFFAHSASLATTDAEIREKLADFKMRLEIIKESNKNLREVIRETMQPVTVAPEEIAEIRGVVDTAMEKLHARAKAFDLTAIVAEVQTIEQQRKERMKMSETLMEKRELLSALDIDNEALQGRLNDLQIRLANIEEETEKILEEKEESSNRLEALSSQYVAGEQKLASVTAELRETQQQIADLKQKNEEVHAEIASKSAELTQMKAKIFENEEALQAFRKKHDQWKAETGLEEQKLKKDFQYRCDALKEEAESLRKAKAEAKKEVERLKVIESYLLQHEENERKAAELRSKLHESRSELEELKRQVENKHQKLNEMRVRHENLRNDIETKKRAMDKEMEDTMAEIQRQEAEVRRIESEGEQMRNKNNEIEGAIEQLKHQLSAKADELAVAKENFRQMLEAQEAEKQKELSMAKKKATPVKLKSFSQLFEERTRGKDSLKQQNSNRKDTEPKLKITMSSDKQHGIDTAAHALESNSEDSPDVMPKKRRHKKRQAGALKVNKVKKPENVTEAEHTAKGPMRKDRSFSDFSPTSGDEADDLDVGNAGGVEADVNKSSSLHHTNTLASTLAEEFMDMDDSITKVDEDEDLFGGAGAEPANKTPSWSKTASVPRRTSRQKSGGTDDDVHFEPNPLFTSTPLVAKKQCMYRPTRGRSSNKQDRRQSPEKLTPIPTKTPAASQASQAMPPMRWNSSSKASNVTPPRRGRPRGRGRGKH